MPPLRETSPCRHHSYNGLWLQAPRLGGAMPAPTVGLQLSWLTHSPSCHMGRLPLKRGDKALPLRVPGMETSQLHDSRRAWGLSPSGRI